MGHLDGVAAALTALTRAQRTLRLQIRTLRILQKKICADNRACHRM